MDNVVCDYCGSSESKKLVVQRDILHCRASPDSDFYLRQCASCGLIYLSPRPSLAEISSFYPEDYSYHSGHNIYRYKIRQFIKDLASVPYIYILLSFFSTPIPYIKERLITLVQPRKIDYVMHLRPCKFLDIGCGSGLSTNYYGYKSSLYHLKKLGFDVTGVEPSDKARTIAQEHGIRVVPTIFDIGDQQFDCVRMNWSLEHVDSPSKYFEEIHKILSPGGKFIVAVPNYIGILYRLYPECVEVPVHTYYFTPDTLEAYFNKYKFNILDKFTFSYPGMFVSASRMLDHNPLFQLTALERIYFQRILNKLDSNMLGNDMVYIAEKIDCGIPVVLP